MLARLEVFEAAAIHKESVCQSGCHLRFDVNGSTSIHWVVFAIRASRCANPGKTACADIPNLAWTCCNASSSFRMEVMPAKPTWKKDFLLDDKTIQPNLLWMLPATSLDQWLAEDLPISRSLPRPKFEDLTFEWIWRQGKGHRHHPATPTLRPAGKGVAVRYFLGEEP